MILHTINKPTALEQCANLISNEDAVVLMEDGVLLNITGLPGHVYLLQSDAAARGITAEESKLIDYHRFVELTIEADAVCNWF